MTTFLRPPATSPSAHFESPLYTLRAIIVFVFYLFVVYIFLICLFSYREQYQASINPMTVQQHTELIQQTEHNLQYCHFPSVVYSTQSPDNSLQMPTAKHPSSSTLSAFNLISFSNHIFNWDCCSTFKIEFKNLILGNSSVALVVMSSVLQI